MCPSVCASSRRGGAAADPAHSVPALRGAGLPSALYGPAHVLEGVAAWSSAPHSDRGTVPWPQCAAPPALSSSLAPTGHEGRAGAGLASGATRGAGPRARGQAARPCRVLEPAHVEGRGATSLGQRGLPERESTAWRALDAAGARAVPHKARAKATPTGLGAGRGGRS